MHARPGAWSSDVPPTTRAPSAVAAATLTMLVDAVSNVVPGLSASWSISWMFTEPDAMSRAGLPFVPDRDERLV